MKSEEVGQGCVNCRRDELDPRICELLTDCGVLRGACVYDELSVAQETQYPDIETSPKIPGNITSLGTRRVEKLQVNRDYL